MWCGDVDRHADADGQFDLHAVEHDAAAERVPDALGEVERGVLVDAAVAQDDELVAADAGHDVRRAGGVGDARRHLGEQGVADLVADGVVDLLEAIDVHEQDGAVVAGAADAVQRFGGGAQQEQPVGQARERVVVRLPGELALEVLGGGDVPRHTTPVLDDAVGAAMHHQVDIERSLESVGCAEAHFATPRGGDRGVHDLTGHLVADGLEEATRPCVAHQVDLLLHTEHPPRGGVRVHRRTVAVEDDHGVVGSC